MRLTDGQLLLAPSDLNDFVECRHLSHLNLRVQCGELRLEPAASVEAELLAGKGEMHERACLEQLKAAGRDVCEAPAADWDAGLEEAAAATERAMRDGREVIYQGCFADGLWRGFADFLFRVDDVQTELGAWGYEAADAKLAKRPKPYFIIQLCFYSEQIARIQGAEPKRMHVVLGSRERRSFLVSDFSAYYRRVRARLIRELAERPETYPYPVAHCAFCKWREHCEAQWLADDHLSLVANIRGEQILKLNACGIARVHELGLAGDASRPARMLERTFDRLRAQARLQAEHADSNRHEYQLLEPEEDRGFALLPEPDAGDVFFDIEGDPFYEDGLEYLFGVVHLEAGRPRFSAFWAEDRASERVAFEELVDWILARRRRFPDLHIYHYAHYEATVLKRLMGLHATREEEVDMLLRESVLVDLYRVVRQSLRVSQSSYSIKKLEAFYREGARDTAVSDGALATVQFEQWLATREQRLLEEIAEYNEDDCVSTWELREWLLRRRAEAERRFEISIPWHSADAQAAERTQALSEDREPLEALQARVTVGVPEDLGAANEAQRARWLLAQLLDYHWREAKPAYWAYFDRRQQSPEELVEDPEAIGELVLDGEPEPPHGAKKLWSYPMRFPAQEHRLAPGKADDPATGKTVEITALDNETGRIRIRHRPPDEGATLPRALIPGKPYDTSEQRAALRRIAEHVAAEGIGGGGAFRAVRGVLLGEAPRVAGIDREQPLQGEHFDLAAARRLLLGLKNSHLFIQGPPGAGKTTTGARLIIELLRAGKRVGVASTSHKAIHTLLEKTEQTAREARFSFRGLKKSTAESPDSEYEGEFITSSPDRRAFPPPAGVGLIAGTAWLFATERMGAVLDCLFIDEAGQVSLADALAMGAAATNVVLLGDPQQLPQVSQAVHPPGSSCSVVEHLLGEDETVSRERGLFLDRTWRMHPSICEFISRLMYEGRLGAAPECARQAVICPRLPQAGVLHVPVDHDGNARYSQEEAEAVAAIVERLLPCEWRRTDGSEHPIAGQDIIVVSPYNAQVRLLRERLPAEVRVGTVDKFQGQEGAVVIYSLATSSAENIPRNLSFLFSRNRLNVALSRARCLAFVVYSARLPDAPTSSIEEMQLVNALCSLVETAAPASLAELGGRSAR
jgi:uncharacterized protein